MNEEKLPPLEVGLTERQKRSRRFTERTGILDGSHRTPSNLNPKPITVEELNAWIGLRKAGVSVPKIARKYNRHVTTIRRKLAQLGVKKPGSKLKDKINRLLDN